VRALVFLCAALPLPGRSLEAQVAAEPDIYAPGYAAHPGRVAHPDGSTSWADAETVRAVFYQDCPHDDVAPAWARLRRQARAPRSEVCPLTAWPEARCVSIVCRDDRAVNPAWSRRAARQRLDVEPLDLPGSHSPFWSRPAALAVLLDGVVAGG
jgi:pimeloyl-ACP methyl ester carboxylesterase